ncbi:hypothetical protein IAD21_01792 [Abditibacteriota bacterium]|nr:hypothetical protein IAD21_01792 [Abditibacteriota bacterium]
MLGIRFFKGLPTEYVIRYRSGKIVARGTGLAFYYSAYNTQIVAVPTASSDGNFIFNEVTRNFQNLAVQGQFTYRIAEPEVAAALLNFSIDPRTRVYINSDPERLAGRVANVIQTQTRALVGARTLEEVLADAQNMATQVLEAVRANNLLGTLGVELLGVFFVGIKPTPEVAKALEAPYREALLRAADEAVYSRRAAAVEEERKIKQNELATDVTLENNRRELIELKGQNTEQEAEFRGRALELEAGYRARALGAETEVFAGLDPRLVLALAMRELGVNAKRIGNLNITPEILASLLENRGDSEKSQKSSQG